jgi:dipeptidase D
VPADKEVVFKKFVEEFEIVAKSEFEEADPGLAIAAETVDMPERVIDLKTQDGLFEAVARCPNGVIAMSADMAGVVETSTNLAIVKSKGDKITIATLQRSSVDASKAKLSQQIRDVFTKAGAKASSSGDYPGWKPNINSPILKTMKEVYNNKYGKVPEVKVIHAGLECGILGAAYPHWDMISFGPTIRHPHSPDEKVEIASVGLFWDYLVETLKYAPVKS